ncbi:MAG: GNAT family N-acetyltransferase [Nocardioidaceae bacterium]|nr:GNAT family N-acetyltransferase [Nocardioidaceae bacterium]
MLTVVDLFVLDRRQVVAGAVQPAVVVPVDPLEGAELDVPSDSGHIPWRYYLWRMLIDSRHQGRGYGRAALDRLTDYLRARPGADALVTSVVPGRGGPLGFYLTYGFESTGEWFDHEQVLRLPLGAPPGR